MPLLRQPLNILSTVQCSPSQRQTYRSWSKTSLLWLWYDFLPQKHNRRGLWPFTERISYKCGPSWCTHNFYWTCHVSWHSSTIYKTKMVSVSHSKEKISLKLLCLQVSLHLRLLFIEWKMLLSLCRCECRSPRLWGKCPFDNHWYSQASFLIMTNSRWFSASSKQFHWFCSLPASQSKFHLDNLYT